MHILRHLSLIFAFVGLGKQHDVQNCRYITIPVCGDDTVTTSLSDVRSRSTRGPAGAPGKSGPRGSSGPKGQKGEAGPPGRDGDNANQHDIKELVDQRAKELYFKMLTMSGADFCKTSTAGVHLVHGELFLCDGNGWTVIQHRADGSVGFERNWNEYKHGFGSLDGEFWIGLQILHGLMRGKRCKLRVDLKAFDQERAYAEYSDFAVADDGKNFRLSISGYNGTAGDSMAFSDGMMFTTIDRDNDRHSSHNCAKSRGGWWFFNCFRASLNAPWGRSSGRWKNIIWYAWKGESEALNSSTMKIFCD